MKGGERMSVTVSDLLALPSLREARVLGGRGGLSKIVSSISVLESTDPNFLVDKLFPQDEFFGSEIVITGFLNTLDNVDCQAANVRRLAEGGEVGLILYYVGVYLESVDQRLIDLADELDFVLICMPEGRRDLRYGEVLSDVTGLIYRDRLSSDAIVSEILERVSRLPQHQRSVNTVLKMLSDRISASVILSDSELRTLNLVAWPRSIEENIKEGLAGWRAGESAADREWETLRTRPQDYFEEPCPFVPGGRLYRCALRPDFGSYMELALIKEGMPLSEELLKQSVDVVRLGVSIWGEQHSEVAVHELVQAILQDEPMKMRRLAEIFHIDVASIHEMWIMVGDRPDSARLLKDRADEFRSALKEHSGVVITDLYKDRLLLFLDTPGTLAETERLMNGLLETALRSDSTLTLTRCGGLSNTAEVRKAYLCHDDFLEDARRLFPRKNLYVLGELLFARECRRLIDEGEEALAHCLSIVNNLQSASEELDLRETLTVYLLDSGSSVTRAAELLFVHKNTVKYRLQRIAELLGYRPDKMPEGMKLYQAAAVSRLLPG